MSNAVGYRCTLCGAVYPMLEKQMTTCPKCGELGILDVEYDYKKISEAVDGEVLKETGRKSLWAFKEFLPVDLEDKELDKCLDVGGTPLYRANRLSDYLEMGELKIKDDGLNPTASLKDRASVMAVVKAIEAGENTIACSSTGNAASSLAGNAARMGLKSVIFVPERAPAGKVAQLMIYGAKVYLVQGDYKETFDMSKRAIDKYGWYNRNAAINPFLVEGKKTVALELAVQYDYDLPDWVIVSVGDGCTIGGVYKGFYDMKMTGLTDRIPKLLGVQAGGCAPLYKAYHELIDDEALVKGVIDAEVYGEGAIDGGAFYQVGHIDNSSIIIEKVEENTIADSISVGMPRNPVKAIRAVMDSNGTYLTVTDEEILEAMTLLGRMEGIFSEPAAAAASAGLVKAIRTGVIGKSERVAVISTGNGLKDIKNAMKAAGEPIKINPKENIMEEDYE